MSRPRGIALSADIIGGANLQPIAVRARFPRACDSSPAKSAMSTKRNLRAAPKMIVHFRDRGDKAPGLRWTTAARYQRAFSTDMHKRGRFGFEVPRFASSSL